MERDSDNSGQQGDPRCGCCGAALAGRSAYQHHGEVLCVDCCMELRADRTRKTHWQYLGAIKTEYLREPED